jgi:PAS domain S-box-containing protein
MTSSSRERVPTPLSGSACSSTPAIAERDRRLDLIYELESHGSELAARVEEAASLRLELASLRDKYFDLYELAPVGYLTIDAPGYVRQANLTAGTILGKERRELVGTRTAGLFELGSADQLHVALARTLKCDGRVELELVAARSGKRLKAWVTRSGEDGVLLALADTAAQHVPTEREAREQPPEFAAILAAIGDGVALIGTDGRIRWCNQGFASLFGKKEERLVGTPLVRLVPGVGSAPSVGRRELVALSGPRRIPVEVTISRPEKRCDGLVVVIADITERRQEQLERNEALLRFNQIAERIDDAFYVAFAGSGESLYVSRAFSDIYGRPLVAHATEPWPRLRWVHADDRQRVVDAVEHLRAGTTFDVEYRVVHPNGDVRFVHDRAFMLADQKRVTGIVRDVTAQRKMQDELRQAQRLEAMGTLASGVAHDFNNLLMGLGGCVQLALLRLEDEHPSRGYLRRAAEAVVRGANLTRQILRIGETRRAPDGTVVLDDVIASTRELVDSIIGDSVRLEIFAGAPEQHVAAEVADIEQILMNLATNARDAMPKGGTLTLVTEPANDHVVLAVKDTGIGMSPAVRARVFEPFFTTKEPGQGTGLGLSTVFALVRRLGGTVALESDVGRGTTVRLCFPLAEAVSDRHAPESRPPGPGGETVLMVDDDPLVRMTVQNHLESLGYRVLVASTAEEAIETCEDPSVQIDLLISDVVMPQLLGPELSKTLAARNKKFPVLYMSAHPKAELVRKGHIGEDARLLAKPFDAAALSEALTATLEEERMKRENAKLRVFVIDDNSDIAEGLQDLLAFEGHTVAMATTPADAIAQVADFAPNVVLCDVALNADIDGFELTQTLRRDPRLERTHFIALTGFQSSECAAQAAQAGIYKVLTKPVETDKLLKLLQALSG